MVTCSLVRIAAIVALAGAALTARAWADPGMTWTQEQAWLNSKTVVVTNVKHGYDSSLGVNTGSANVQVGQRQWSMAITLTRDDVVTEEIFSPPNGSKNLALENGSRAEQRLIRKMYGQSGVATEFASAVMVATVQLNGETGEQKFFAVTNGQYGFMLDPYELVVFRNSELNARIKRAQYCSTHTGCG